MRICIVAEGCYPYVVGGVSGWIHGMIKSFPDQEFVILAIVTNRSVRGKYVYELPENVTEIHELYLEDSDWGKRRRRRSRMNKKEYEALRSLVLNQRVEWEVLFDFFQKQKYSLNDLLMGEDFLNAVTEYYKLNYSQIVFTDFLWTMRSIYLPLFFYNADGNPQGGFVSLCIHRICRYVGEYGQICSRRPSAHLGAWYLYP